MSEATPVPDEAASSSPSKPFRAVHDLTTHNAAFLVVFGIFTIMAIDILQSDLWFDEIITLFDYAVHNDWKRIFQKYPVANNHMLYSFTLWYWVHFIGVINSEVVLRFPGYIFAIITLLLMFFQTRRHIDRSAAFFITLMMALSPVYLSFFYQLRGYGLSMLLATMALIGLFDILSGRQQGWLMYVIGTVLLPITLPSNLLFNFSIWAFATIVLLRRERSGKRFVQAFVLGVSGVVGMAVYLPILPQFMKVVKATGGWPSGALVCGNWTLALFAHCGFFMLACVGLAQQQRRQQQQSDVESTVHEEATPEPEEATPFVLADHLHWLLLTCLLPMLLLIFVRSPFPRVLVVYLPALTFCSLLVYRPTLCRRNLDFYLLLFFVVANGMVWSRTNTYLNDTALTDGKVRQNLLQQFYARNADVSIVSRLLAETPMVPPNTRIFIDVHFFPGLHYYWAYRWNQHPLRLECMGGGPKMPLKMNPSDYRSVPQVILAYNAERAAQQYLETTGLKVRLRPLRSPTALQIFQVIDTMDPANPTPGAPTPPTPPPPPPPAMGQPIGI